MTQTGVPFGEVAAVRDWLGIRAEIKKPPKQHPKRPILGFDCQRSEVSGRRLWGLFAERFGSPEMFFADHFVANYCPLVFCEESGCNRTPDKLPQPECRRLFAVCDKHLREVAHVLDPEWVIGVGGFAADRARDVLSPLGIRVGQILHPSPASPAANRGWSKIVTAQLVQTGVWS
jgi:single-strand selective monofunctional uracil DNA glycosylase